MQVTLYKFDGESNELNKLQTQAGITQLFTGDVTPYGAFNASNVVFTLEDMYNANYCIYEYNSKTYYGFCKVDVRSNGLYQYTVNVDALTTAWYGNCFPTWNRYIRCPLGQSGGAVLDDGRPINEDPLFPFSATPSISHVYPLSTAYSNNSIRILMQVTQPPCYKYSDPDSASWPTDTDYTNAYAYTQIAGDDVRFHIKKWGEVSSNTAMYRYPIGVVTYVLTLPQFKTFCAYLRDNSDAEEAASKVITKLAIVDTYSLDFDDAELIKSQWIAKDENSPSRHWTGIPFINPGATNGVFNNAMHFVITSSTYYAQEENALNNNVLMFPHELPATYWAQGTRLHILKGLEATAYNVNPISRNQYIFHVPYLQTPVTVKYSDIAFTESPSGSTKVIIGSLFDPGSFVIRYVPATAVWVEAQNKFINIKPIPLRASENVITSQFPMALDTSITNWTSALLSVATTAGMAIATVATQGATAPYLIGAAGGTAATLASTSYQDEHGGSTVVGTTGGCNRWGFYQPPMLEVYEWITANNSRASNYRYGQVCDFLYVFPLVDEDDNTISGAYQFLDSHFECKGYEKSVIEQAEIESGKLFHFNGTDE